MGLRCTVSVLLVVALVQAQPQGPIRPLFSSNDRLADWDFEGSGKWGIRDGKLVLEVAGVPGGAIRKPAALAILRTKPLRDFDLNVQLRSTTSSTQTNRDLIIVFGHQSPTRFYYVHLSAIRDAVHNGIFLVADADRRRIDTLSNTTPLTDQNWHTVRLERRATGQVRVFVDSSLEPIMLALDTTFTTGLIGLGSFDDTGEFRGFEVEPLK